MHANEYLALVFVAVAAAYIAKRIYRAFVSRGCASGCHACETGSVSSRNSLLQIGPPDKPR